MGLRDLSVDEEASHGYFQCDLESALSSKSMGLRDLSVDEEASHGYFQCDLEGALSSK